MVQAPPGIDVDDVAQQSFVAAFTRLRDYELGTNFAAWLFTIARFQRKTEVSRLRRVADYHVRYAPDLLQRELERRDSEPPEFYETRLEHLQLCVGGLGEHLRRFIKGRYEDEIPLKEMAARCGRSEAAVKKQLWKLRDFQIDPSLDKMKDRLPSVPFNLVVESIWCHTLYDQVGLAVTEVELIAPAEAETN